MINYRSYFQKLFNIIPIKTIDFVKAVIIRLGLACILFYQKIISPLLPARCRYYPTCSEYAKQALLWHGVDGIKLLIWRLCRCQPFGGHGVDFVPLPLKKYDFYQTNIKIYAIYLDHISYRAYRNHLMKY